MEKQSKKIVEGIRCADLLCEGKTIREIAKIVGYSKSSVHLYLMSLASERPDVYQKVRKTLDRNKKEGPIRGGEATRIKYLKKRGLYEEENHFSGE